MTICPFWEAAGALFSLPLITPPFPYLPSQALPPSTIYFLRTNSLQPSTSSSASIASTPHRNMKRTRPNLNMDDNPDSATLDEVKKSTKSLRLAVEHAISLHVSPKEVRDVVNLAIEEGMKKHISLAVKRAISANASPEQVRAVVEDAIKEEELDTRTKRRSTKLTIGQQVPFANLVIVQRSLVCCCWGQTPIDWRKHCFSAGGPEDSKMIPARYEAYALVSSQVYLTS